ncbi:hypothetical protein LEP1GSC173_1044 [Leptospira interrogans str. HAI1594]|uniref:Uncharacterized protein n=1 Tax=Leptospira interrogans serovar Copenhageni str. LT2050 TaxID=1001598 RepID=M3IQP9_LEPIT|nr:hypothetical protein AMR47_15330 [Leptospira interrogans]EKP22551.1 hypothetical protein LEP1GSC117_3780 [Leptospira interrogans serovar Icterohaemorrhagiae str. Verdun LP]EKP75805.1 hypothetical protein LEP1GSC173_1044 [Leptospira interrogans str. HAI1594]EMG23478.1 hypothetical protein LEP1GSC150_2512 [Leptospira interrogans serovar Copenhageni str. LT2050]EMO16829.1 hypothetical protein LEP1GSC167_2578 [Leptospira interrogans serovar Copenhageni str. HAI0188]EMO38551.1 hypothetical prote
MREKKFSKSIIATILEFVRKIVICSSSHIVLQTNLSFSVVPTLFYRQI